MNYRDLHGPITAASAEAEPEAQRLFGPTFDAKMQWHRRWQSSGINKATYRPWKKPRIQRVK